MPSAHDASYKLLFSAPELVRDLVLGFIPDAWLHSLDYSTLEKMPGSYVSDDMRHRADDAIVLEHHALVDAARRVAQHNVLAPVAAGKIARGEDVDP